jgi:hypothetical protein
MVIGLNVEKIKSEPQANAVKNPEVNLSFHA